MEKINEYSNPPEKIKISKFSWNKIMSDEQFNSITDEDYKMLSEYDRDVYWAKNSYLRY